MPPRSRTVAVGAFLFMVLVLSGMSIFFLAPDIFEPNAALYTPLKDVIGLTEGSAVRLSGRYVGTLKRMDLVEIETQPYWKLSLEIHKFAQDKIRADSVASSKTQGLLGKKYINIT